MKPIKPKIFYAICDRNSEHLDPEQKLIFRRCIIANADLFEEVAESCRAADISFDRAMQAWSAYLATIVEIMQITDPKWAGRMAT